MNEDDFNTTAGRLAFYVESALYADAQQPALQEWKRIFGIDEVGGVLRCASELTELAQQVALQVRALPDDEDPDHLLEEWPNIEVFLGCFGHVGNSQMELFQRTLSAATVYSLKTCARALRRQRQAEPVVPEEDAKSLVELVRAVIDEIAASGLPADLKRELINRLRDVEWAILNVRIGGYEGIAKALDSFTFRSTLNSRGAGDEDKERMVSWWTRLWTGLTKAARGAAELSGPVATTVENIRQITGS
ncbi:hypothetical protein ACIA5C_19885 [Actinoplanes sp. NPDC051343]|uniref:hypothetical protein n=1 Tax=Actinoplanes sp. NPDC051343 TaxID=3363906 RepID=UPI0037896BD2